MFYRHIELIHTEYGRGIRFPSIVANVANVVLRADGRVWWSVALWKPKKKTCLDQWSRARVSFADVKILSRGQFLQLLWRTGKGIRVSEFSSVNENLHVLTNNSSEEQKSRCKPFHSVTSGDQGISRIWVARDVFLCFWSYLLEDTSVMKL